MDDDADGRVDGEGDAVDQRVGDADGEDREDAEVEAAAREDLDELGVVEEAMLFELALYIGQSKFCSIDRDVEVGEDPREAADVILMPVRKNNPADFRSVLDEVADVGDDDVDAEELFFWEHEAGVDHDDVVTVVECEAVHAELAESAERDYLQFFISHGPSVYRSTEGRAGFGKDCGRIGERLRPDWGKIAAGLAAIYAGFALGGRGSRSWGAVRARAARAKRAETMECVRPQTIRRKKP